LQLREISIDEFPTNINIAIAIILCLVSSSLEEGGLTNNSVAEEGLIFVMNNMLMCRGI